MRILPDDSYIYRMINVEVDRRILDQIKSKEFSEHSWEDYLSKAKKEREARYETVSKEDASR